MTPVRAQLLEEIGISPLWTLRERPAAGRRSAEPVSRPAPQVGIASGPQTPVAGVAAVMQADGSTGRGNATPPADVAQMDWSALKQSIAACRACGLCAARRQAVVGVGDEAADWLFIGEGPGADEDERGEPFVGQAGKLLDAMLAAIDLKRARRVYIANAVKCRPPNNRTPEPAEIAACRPFLERQIALLQPKVIVVLGKTAAASLLGEGGSLSGLRGKSHVYRGAGAEIPVVVSYHPAYLLRSLGEKAKAWEDLCRARDLMRQPGD